MNTQILQNLTQPGEIALLPHEGDENLFRATIRRIKGKLVEAYKRQSSETAIHEAIQHLHSLTDEQLRDMGISRMDIAHVVRYGKD